MNIDNANTLLQAFTSSHSGKGKYPEGFERVETNLEVFTENETPFLAYSLWNIAKLSGDKWEKLLASWKNGAFSPDADSEKGSQPDFPDGKHTLSSQDYLSLRYIRLLTLWSDRNKDAILRGKKVSFSLMDELNNHEQMVQEYLAIKTFEDALQAHLPKCQYWYLTAVPGKTITLFVEKLSASELLKNGYTIVKDSKGIAVGKIKPNVKPDDFGDYLETDKVYCLRKDIGE